MHFLNNYFYWGIGIGVFLGLIGIVFAVHRLWETKAEVRRLKRHLAEKLELEAEATNRLRQDLQELRQQNENLRIKVANLNQYPDKRLQRDLEFSAWAEPSMVPGAPDFLGVWRQAQRSQQARLGQDRNGNHRPRAVLSAHVSHP